MRGRAPTLSYVYGPPAAGKLTVASHLVERTGASLFHNHLTVTAVAAVFPFQTPAYDGVLHRLRLDVAATAARHGIDLVFTNNAAWRGDVGGARFAAFAAEMAGRFEAEGGVVRFVQLVAPVEVLEARLADASRAAHGKLLDVDRLHELLATYDPAPLHPDDLVVDTSVLGPDEAADVVAADLERRRAVAAARATRGDRRRPS